MFEFSSHLETDSDWAYLRGVDQQFQAWVGGKDGSFHAALAVLTVIRTVLRYEWDRPFYRYWYREKLPFAGQQYRETLKHIPHSPGDTYSEFINAARRYSPSRSAISRLFG